ncbi:MAG: hypothetical protein ACWGQW_03425 [bacterium]
MKSIRIDEFGTSMSMDTRTITRDGKEVEVEYLRIWIQVHASYEHWDGGTNGCKIFVYRGELYETSYGDLALHSTVE